MLWRIALRILGLAPLAWVLAQAGDGGTTLNWGTVLGGAVGSSPVAAVLVWRLAKADARIVIIESRDDERITRYETLLEKNAVLLHDVAETLGAVKESMDVTVSRVQSQPGVEQADLVTRRLELLLDEMRQERTARRKGGTP